jgi:hypothetical protein
MAKTPLPYGQGTRDRALAQTVETTADSFTPDETTEWASTDPTTLNTAINRLAAAFKALLAKLDDDAGVTDTDYESTLLP